MFPITARRRARPVGSHRPNSFTWSDAPWKGIALDETVIYELHVGAFSPEGTFAGVAAQLPRLIEMGVTAIELMPVAAFPGTQLGLRRRRLLRPVLLP